ncbi:CPBP family intramembrane glutamic endopeptidase [Halovivax cerinus]|uniref:CPBP family intramembrane glutamic endopeptidase n=1 Tax=Halovivax cerinus TaxID=1487865 RepID=A0ABD5NPQ8_9EURY|nr:CPBP family intramembrane glutamic endopeptidase [Halovivax cerinus]
MSTSQSSPSVQAPGGPLRAVFVALSLSVAGLLVATATATPAGLLDPSILTDPAAASDLATVVYLILQFLGYALTGALYLRWTGRGWDWLDLERPTGRGWRYVVYGVVGSIAFLIAVQVVATVLDLSSSDNQVMGLIGNDPNMVLVMIVIVFAFNAPAEEFLFRNVVQKRLYSSFSRVGAVLVAALIFALSHVPTYALAADGSFEPAGAIATSLAVVFGGAVIFGYLYARSDNLLVPIIAHATFNAIQFGLLYLALRYAPEELESSTAILGALVAAVPV